MSLLYGLLVILSGVALARLGVSSRCIAVEPGATVESATFLEEAVDELIVASNDEFEELKNKLLARRDGRFRVDFQVESFAKGVRRIRARLIDTVTGREMDHIVAHQTRID